MKRFKNILCVIDPEKTPSTTLARAVTLAENNQADLTVVAVAERVAPVTGMAEGDAISPTCRRRWWSNMRRDWRPWSSLTASVSLSGARC